MYAKFRFMASCWLVFHAHNRVLKWVSWRVAVYYVGDARGLTDTTRAGEFCEIEGIGFKQMGLLKTKELCGR